ncbi:hypothetical protein [Persicobacter diffluens]|uniref:Uncharacterized protein n=1 Tax=Persicobacter diffluens TaxID=981 RepID=A0AAN4VV94_9BACT|nr:hypothetical protein PEDI_11430 [Persicobacter diffluens]
MNLKTILILALSFIVHSGFSQDKLFFFNEESISCKILSIQNEEILIQKADEELFISTEDLIAITYKGEYIDLRYTSVSDLLNRSRKRNFIKEKEPSFPDINENMQAFWVNREFQVIKAHKISLEKPVLGKRKLVVDGKELSSNEVIFYGHFNEVFANELLIGNSGNHRYLKMTKSGKINIFTKEVNAHTAPNYNPHTGMWTGGTIVSKTKVMYFNHGFEPLQKANYSNLKKEMQGDPAAIRHLKKCQTNNIATIVINTLGAGVMLASFLSDTGTSSNGGPPSQGESVDVKIPAGVIIGAGMIAVGWTFQIGNYKNIDRAIDTYNAGY